MRHALVSLVLALACATPALAAAPAPAAPPSPAPQVVTALPGSPGPHSRAHRVSATTASPDTVAPRNYPGLPAYPVARRGVPRSAHILVMRVFWSPTEPKFPDTAAMKKLMRETATWFKQTSRGKHHVSSKVTPWLRISGGSSNCSSTYNSTKRAVAAARSKGFGAGGFNRFMIVMPQCATNSLGEVSGRVTWIKESQPHLDVLTHELGHNLGLDHANSLICHAGKQRLTQAGKCSGQEYGDLWDAMGISSRPYSVPILQRLGWAGRVVTANKSGTWKLRDAEASGKGIQAVRVKVSQRVSYWLEYHTTDVASEKQPGSFAITGTAGLQVRLDTGRKSMQILDAAPGNPDDFLFFPDPDLVNATLPAGSSFTTPQQIRITLVSQDATGATVRVTRNQKAAAPDAPTISTVLRRQDSDQVTVSVRSGADNGQVILGYLLQRSPGGDAKFVADPGGTKTTITVDDVGDGTGSWTMRTVNQVGTSAASTAVTEHVPHPVVTSITPAAGATVQGPVFPVTVTVEPDPVTGSPVTSVQLCRGIVSFNSCQNDDAAPFTFSVRTYGASSEDLIVDASDANDDTVRVTETVNVLPALPSVRIDGPANGAGVVAETPFPVTVTATPSPFSGTPIQLVELTVYDAGGNSVYYTSDDTAPYAMDVTVQFAGTYRIDVQAMDQDGNTATASIQVVATGP